MEQFIAKDRLHKALSHPSHKVPFVYVGQPVVFHRSKSSSWLHGTCTSLDGSTVYIERNGKIYSAHESRVKPFVTPVSLRHNTPTAPTPSKTTALPTNSLNPAVQVFLANTTTSPRIAESNHRNPRWDVPKQTEIANFRNLQAMDTIPRATVPQDCFIYPYKWHVTECQDRGNGKPPLRARYCLQGQLDSDKKHNVASSPVASLRAIRTSLGIASIQGWHIRTEDFKRAYLQSEPLDKPIYAEIPPEAGESPQHVWAFKVPLYGKDDAGRKFFFTMDKNNTQHIPNISRSSAFDAVYLIPNEGILCVYSDDTKAAGTKSFLEKVSLFTRNFRTHKSDVDNIKFAGMFATASSDGIIVHLNNYIDSLKPLPISADLTSFRRLIAQFLWIGRISRPDILCDAVKLMGTTTMRPSLIPLANSILAHAQQFRPQIHFPRLNPDNLRLHVFTDFSGSSQTPHQNQHLGYLIGLTDNSSQFAPLFWNSHKPKRVCRGTGAGELVALSDGLNMALDICVLIQEATSRRVPLSAYTDATSVHDACSGSAEPADLQGKTDVYFVRQLLQRQMLSELNHIDSGDNPADALSKSNFLGTKPNKILAAFLRTGTLRIAVRKTTTGNIDSESPRIGLTFKQD